MKNTRFLSLLLLGAMLVPSLTACGGGGTAEAADTGDAGGANNVQATAAETTAAETDRSETKDSLPALDFKGATVGVNFPESHGGKADQIDWATEDTGDVVASAVYQRQISVEERLNVKFDIDWSLTTKNYKTTVQTDITSGAGTWDLLYGPQSIAATLVTEGMYLDLAKAKYIDYAQPWWFAEVLDEMTVGGKRFMLTGDVSLSMLSYMSCYYFNKEQWESVTGKKDTDLYELVLAGNWTYDKLGEYCKMSYKDTNGNGAYDDTDTYGTGVVCSSTCDHMTFDSGLKFTSFDNKGVPSLAMNNERTILFTEKMCDLFYNNPGVRIFPATQDVLRITIPNKLMNNELTFMSGYYYSSTLLRDMKADYGIIPYPKLDDNVKQYYSLFHNSTQLISIPVTCKQTDTVTACIEAIAAENYRTVTPAYYEVALKSKYTRDEISGQIIDLIRDGMTTDFVYIYAAVLQNAGLVMRDLAAKNDKNFASFYKTNESAYQSKLADLIAAFQKVE